MQHISHFMLAPRHCNPLLNLFPHTETNKNTIFLCLCLIGQKILTYHFFQVMRQFQSSSRSHETRDYNLLSDNASYVQTWSSVQCFVVILCTVIQVSGSIIAQQQWRNFLLSLKYFQYYSFFMIGRFSPIIILQRRIFSVISNFLKIM